MTSLRRHNLHWIAHSPGTGVSLPASLPVHLSTVTQPSVRVLDRKNRRLGHRLDSEFVYLADCCAAAYLECSQVTLRLTHLTHICDKTVNWRTEAEIIETQTYSTSRQQKSINTCNLVTFCKGKLYVYNLVYKHCNVLFVQLNLRNIQIFNCTFKYYTNIL